MAHFAVSSPTTVTITARIGRNIRSTAVKVNPPSIVNYLLSSGTVRGGSVFPVYGNVYISPAAPASGLAITLSSQLPLVASVPATVTVPGGTNFVRFRIRHYKVQQQTSVLLTASTTVTTRTATLTVTP